MPPRKVPKLDGQGQRKLSSFFNAESTKIDRKNDEAEHNRRLQVPAEVVNFGAEVSVRKRRHVL